MWASNKEKGFTLLEILIAIVILSFITFGVVQITEDAVNTKDRTLKINEDNLQIETALARMEWDFSQIYSPLYFSGPMTFPNPQNSEGNPEINSQQNYLNMYREQMRSRFQTSQHFSSVSSEGIPIPRFFAPEKNILEFMTSSNRRKTQNTLQTHYAWIRYGLEEAKLDTDFERNERIPSNVKNLIRYVANSDAWRDERIDTEDIDNMKKAVILENVESLEFDFWDLEKRKWESTLRNIKDGESILRGVRMKLTWYDESGNKRELTKVFRPHWPLVTPVIQNVSNPNQKPSGGQATPESNPNNESEPADD